MVRLIKPSVRYQDSFIAALREDPTEPLPPLLNQLKKNRRLTAAQFPDWLRAHFDLFLHYSQSPFAVPKDFPRLPLQYQYWLVNSSDFIGRAIFRPHLNDSLKRQGGHVGIWVRPSFRHHGYGTLLLAYTTQKASAFGLHKLLLTCQTTNQASQKLIHKFGARRAALSRWSTENRDRYWLRLPLKSTPPSMPSLP